MLEADDVKGRKEAFQLNELIMEIINQFRKNDEVNDGNVELRFSLAIRNEQSTVYTDRDMLKRIVINLVDNALKYTERGFVEVGYGRRNEGNIVFHIKDTGKGIPEDQRGHVFDKFKKADESEKRMYSGTGLGLSVSKGFVEKLGGNIWFDSMPGQGSTFYFNIPVEAY